MQNHLKAMKKKSIITHLETHLIWFVCLHIYKIIFRLFVKINVAFLSPQPAFMHICAAVAPFSAVYLSR